MRALSTIAIHTPMLSCSCFLMRHLFENGDPDILSATCTTMEYSVLCSCCVRWCDEYVSFSDCTLCLPPFTYATLATLFVLSVYTYLITFITSCVGSANYLEFLSWNPNNPDVRPFRDQTLFCTSDCDLG